MDENKKTPARRRRGGGQRQSGRKNYASEGDVLSEMPIPSGYPTTYPPTFAAGFPATPSKSNTGSPAPGSHQANPKSTSKKNGRKGRPDSLSTTPGPLRPGRGSPPQSASSFEAFAASRHFHASPAPSTLPMPKFKLRRSESAGMRPTQEQSPPASDCETPSPSQPAILARAQTEDHLSLLFNAHRAEQERKQKQDKEEQANRSHSANASSRHEQGPFSAPSGLQVSQGFHTFNDQPVPFRLPTRPAQRGMPDATEQPVFAARPEVFSMPLHERIRAARAAGAHPQHMQQTSPQPRQLGQSQLLPQQNLYTTPLVNRTEHMKKFTQSQQQQRQPPQDLPTTPLVDSTEQMKKLLGIAGATPSPAPAPAPTHYHANPSAALSPSAQSTGNLQTAVNHPGYAAPAQTDDVKKRGENALRQVLGLQLHNFLPLSTGFDGNSSPRPQLDHTKSV